jgi:hypothetical protein
VCGRARLYPRRQGHSEFRAYPLRNFAHESPPVKFAGIFGESHPSCHPCVCHPEACVFCRPQDLGTAPHALGSVRGLGALSEVEAWGLYRDRRHPVSFSLSLGTETELFAAGKYTELPTERWQRERCGAQGLARRVDRLCCDPVNDAPDHHSDTSAHSPRSTVLRKGASGPDGDAGLGTLKTRPTGLC